MRCPRVRTLSAINKKVCKVSSKSGGHTINIYRRAPFNTRAHNHVHKDVGQAGRTGGNGTQAVGNNKKGCPIGAFQVALR